MQLSESYCGYGMLMVAAAASSSCKEEQVEPVQVKPVEVKEEHVKEEIVDSPPPLKKKRWKLRAPATTDPYF